MKYIFQLIFLLVFSQSFSQSTLYKTLTDLYYYETPVNDTYQNERCKLDLYFPEAVPKFPNRYMVPWGWTQKRLKSDSRAVKGQRPCRSGRKLPLAP